MRLQYKVDIHCMFQIEYSFEIKFIQKNLGQLISLQIWDCLRPPLFLETMSLFSLFLFDGSPKSGWQPPYIKFP